MKQYRTYIFDLDGTLLDTLEDLYLSVNHALRLMQMPERTMDEIRWFVGNGVRRLVERSVSADCSKEQLEETYRLFKEYYLFHGEEHTKPYPQIIEMLTELRQRGIRTGVVSNKFQAATDALCDRFFPNLVDAVVGEQPGLRLKPAADMVERVLSILHADKSEAVYVGDSDVDILTARNSGLPCISVLWGFKDRETLLQFGATCLIDNSLQLIDVLS